MKTPQLPSNITAQLIQEAIMADGRYLKQTIAVLKRRLNREYFISEIFHEGQTKYETLKTLIKHLEEKQKAIPNA